MENNQATIKDIAKQLNISVSTVSRALSNNPRIGFVTRKKVEQMAKQLEYEPNMQAVSLKQGRSNIIGVVVPFLKDDFFSEAVSAIESVALDQGCTILLGQSYDSIRQEIKVVDSMKKQRVDGLIISLSKETSSYEHLTAFSKYDIPVVYFDRVPSSDKVHKVVCNIHKVTTELVAWLFNKGCRRIGLINGPDKLQGAKERLSGYMEGITKHKLKVDMQLVEETDLSKEGTHAAMIKLFSLKKTPTAIITFNEYVHMDAVQYAIKHDINANKDVAFVSYANMPITGYTACPPLATIEQYPYAQGEKAMELLTGILKEKSLHLAEDQQRYHVHEMAGTLIENRDFITNIYSFFAAHTSA